ncbi:MAG: hypothetical protein HY814_12635 [Candidatus Riflebacteria bacterium]|nr:hypothetical protein [Candidatus Riflebacteria bacterium]
MKILHICDAPDQLMDLNDLAKEKIDLVLSSGDLPRPIYARVRSALGDVPVYGVHGAHDAPSDLQPTEDLHLRVVEVGGLKFGGFQGSWRYKPGGRYLYSDNEVAVALERYSGVDVFVTHNPPALIGHEILDDVHNGFTSFVEYCARFNVRYLFHGHSAVVCESRMGQTRVFGSHGKRVVTIEE